MKLSDKKCRNPECDFSAECVLRFFTRPAAELARSLQKPHTTDKRPAPDHRIQFTMRVEKSGWVGLLFVNGRVDDGIAGPLKEVETALSTLAGLLVIYDCPGGFSLAGSLLERLTLIAKQTMPVIAYVRDASSAAILPSLAADRTFGNWGCTCGCFGSLNHICDGKEPAVIVSSQTPKKFTGGKLPWPPKAWGDAQDRARLQVLADVRCDEDFALIEHYSGTPADRLRPYMDGRSLTAEEALEAGLIEKICSEDDAYADLLRAIETLKNERKK